MDALTTPSVVAPYILSATKCVEASVNAPCDRNVSRMETPSAPPSSGSVARPNSSSNTSDAGVTACSNSRTCAMCAEKLLRLSCDGLLIADVGQYLLKHRELGLLRPAPARPDWAINTSSPTVFIDTVLPPVFGPLINRVRCVLVQLQRDRDYRLASAPQHVFEQRVPRVLGQQQPAPESGLKRGMVQRKSSANSAFANSSSSTAMVSTAAGSGAHARATAPSFRAGCAGSRAALPRAAGPAHYSGRWFRAARRTACGRCRLRRESRRPLCAAGLRPPAPRSDRCAMVMKSSCSVPSS